MLTALNLALSPTFPAAGSFNDCGTRCPANPLAVGDVAIGRAVNSAASVVFTIALIGLTMLLLDKARAAGPVMRRAVTPVAAVFAGIVVWFVISLYVLPAYPETASAVTIVNGVLGLAGPLAIFLGQVWGDRFAAISLGRIAVRARDRPLTPSAVEEVLADALGDSTVKLALWDGVSGYVDVDGEPVELPVDPQARGVTLLSQDSRPVAALIHDPMLDTDSALVEGLAASSLMMLENVRLVAELRASRARIVATAEQERRRLERDLHDGAQQSLLAIRIRLGLVADSVDDPKLAAQLDAIGDPVRGGNRGPPRAGPRHLSANAAGFRAGRRAARICDDRLDPGDGGRRRGHRPLLAHGRGGDLLLRSGGRPERHQARRQPRARDHHART